MGTNGETRGERGGTRRPIGLLGALEMMGVPVERAQSGAMRAPARLFMQDMGVIDGQRMVMVGGIVAADLLSTPTKEAELWTAMITIEPVRRARDTEGAMRGVGLAGAVTNGGLDFDQYGEEY